MQSTKMLHNSIGVVFDGRNGLVSRAEDRWTVLILDLLHGRWRERRNTKGSEVEAGHGEINEEVVLVVEPSPNGSKSLELDHQNLWSPSDGDSLGRFTWHLTVRTRPGILPTQLLFLGVILQAIVQMRFPRARNLEGKGVEGLV